MRGYLKAAVFIAVLLLSVSWMASAIDILGNLSDVKLDEDLQRRETAKPAGPADTELRRGEVVEVESSPAGSTHPLFKIHMPPRTRYLRRSVGEVYEDGAWRLSEDHRAVPYHGQELMPNVSGYHTIEPVIFLIEPLVNMTGFVPVTLSTYQIVFEGTLDRYPALEAYSSPESFTSSYWVSHALFEFSEDILRAARLQNPGNSLDVPEELYDRLRGLASEIAEDASTPIEKLRALEGYLKENYEYNESYASSPSDVDPVEWFLFHEKRGVCSHFNSAFVLLARSIDLPTRIVNGYLVDPDLEIQTVMPKQAHVYAEAKFRNLSWITFDATPERMEEKPQTVYRISTVTNITGNDEVGIKGHHFKVCGTVTASNGSQVDGLTVQVELRVSKNERGVLCGHGEVDEGIFNITCEASANLEVGMYMLVAHAIGNEIYEGSWSDPDIKIMAETEITIEALGPAYVGENITLRGRLIESSSRQPIPNTDVVMEVENETLGLTTDSKGIATVIHAFDTEGNKTVVLSAEDSDFYLGSSGVVGITVTPPPSPSLLDVLTIFPYNVMVVSTCAAMGAVILYARKRRRLQSLQAIEKKAPAAEVVEDETPLSFDSYKEGIVKLFNRFYASTQRRFSEVEDSLTPREFQQVLQGKIPEKGVHPLDDLVTAFEIANYSEAYPPKEAFDRCRTAVDMLNGLMEHG